jgi:hypothetical protein
VSEELRKNEVANGEPDVTEEQELDLDELGQVTGGSMRNNVYISQTKDIDESIKNRI